jgi:Asp-tRNA(Asn)/Glu-tRNA(Gln) amidotransferase A subunit family amidase
MTRRLTSVVIVVLLFDIGIDARQAPAPRPSRFEIQEATIDQIQQAIGKKQITTRGVVEAYLRRIKAYNGTCVNEPQGILGPITTKAHAGQINALSTLNLRPAARTIWGFDERKARSLTDKTDAAANMPDALETASEQDRQFAQTGRLVGPLHGVVLAIKDQYDTVDMRTTSGADVDYANDRPADDATFVRRLRDAGAIILAKANLAEYAVDGARSSFGGTFCNPYDTEREPGMSSAGSATAVAANLVTCAIAEETVVSVRWPASVNSTVGLAPTQELVSRDGMMGAGLNMRVGPICRTVQDTAKVLDAYAGYDPKDELTVFSIGRKPQQPYASSASATRLDGLRIGVLREYMRPSLLTKADEESIAIVDRAIARLRTLGAVIVDPGAEGELFTRCIARYAPELLNSAFARQYPQLLPADPIRTTGDQIAALLDLHVDPSRVPRELSLRTLNAGGFGPAGEGKYMMNRYLRERGDANIKTNADLIEKARFYQDPHFPDRRQAREQAERATTFDMSARLQGRHAVQTILLQCMQEQRLDALVSPMSTVPPRKLTSPREPVSNGRSPIGWSLIGQQGFPAITVPAGFTTAVWDRAADGTGGSRLVGPVPVALPVGVDFMARPFDEPLLFRIASAYEASTHHRRPPADFAPVSGAAAGQNPDQRAAQVLVDGSDEVVRTVSTRADRFETDHVVLYIDKDLLSAAAEREFVDHLERHFVATSDYLQRRFDPVSRKTAKPTYYLTNRAGISHAEASRVFLFARRVIPSPAIAIHETVHLLLFTNPRAPRTRSDLSPEEDLRMMATTGVWLAEGFANYVAYELAPKLGLEPDRLFVKGDRTTVDAEARSWIREPRGAGVLPFVGSRGVPDGFLADRANVAPPFYVLSHSFIKHLVDHAGLALIVRLYEQHFAGTRSIEEDVKRATGRDLAEWRREWLRVIES